MSYIYIPEISPEPHWVSDEIPEDAVYYKGFGSGGGWNTGIPHSEETKKKMMEETNLGPIYGFQWRHFGADYTDCYTDYTNKGFDQIQYIIDEIKANPTSRRLVLSGWPTR